VTGKEYRTLTDEYGEFRLWKLDRGLYTVSFYKEGYCYKEISKVDSKTCTNLGDVRLMPFVG
jgi:hypothetical protein